MIIDVVSIFPEIFQPVFQIGILRIAQERELVRIDTHDLRDYCTDKHRQVDDEPYGGGPGMVMKPGPFFAALEAILQTSPFLPPRRTRTILLTPGGEKLEQKIVSGLARSERLVFLCGRYEGVDARVSAFVTDEISVGDYVLSGGETAAMMVIDSVVRLLSGALGDEESLVEESFAAGGLEYPQYTRPAQWRGLQVPEVLLSGNHRAIAEWRRERSVRLTDVRRPDLCREKPGA